MSRRSRNVSSFSYTTPPSPKSHNRQLNGAPKANAMARADALLMVGRAHTARAPGDNGDDEAHSTACRAPRQPQPARNPFVIESRAHDAMARGSSNNFRFMKINRQTFVWLGVMQWLRAMSRLYTKCAEHRMYGDIMRQVDNGDKKTHQWRHRRKSRGAWSSYQETMMRLSETLRIVFGRARVVMFMLALMNRCF